MPITIGEPIDERDDAGRLKVNIATVFPRSRTIVTAPPHFHALQRLAYLEGLKLNRQREGLPPLSPAEEASVIEEAVDLVADERGIFIRPNTARMDLVVAADEVPRVVRGLILNIAQEFDGLEYVNLGTLLPATRCNTKRGGRHEVYLAQIKQRRAAVEVLQIIRMQKWGVAERLDKGHSLESPDVLAGPNDLPRPAPQ